jgi:hypothetical protein
MGRTGGSERGLYHGLHALSAHMKQRCTHTSAVLALSAGLRVRNSQTGSPGRGPPQPHVQRAQGVGGNKPGRCCAGVFVVGWAAPRPPPQRVKAVKSQLQVQAPRASSMDCPS